MEHNADTARKGMKKKFVDNLAKTVIETAKAGKWSITVAELSEDSTADDIAKMALNAAFKQFGGGRDNVPEWFDHCMIATKTIMEEDEMQGLECVAALYMATDNATAEQKMTAIGKLLDMLKPKQTGISALGVFGGM